MTLQKIFKTSLLIFTSSLFATSAAAEDVTLKGSDAFKARQKMTCGTTEQGVARYAVFEGRVYSRVQGEKDRHIFNALGINTRHCKVVDDPKKGKGFRSVSREIMVYMDPKTGKVIDKWKNPWTNEMIDVMHVANDPVNMKDFRYEKPERKKRSDLKIRRYGDVAWSSNEVPLFYQNPLGGEYQNYVGGTYHAMEIFNSQYDAEKLIDPEAIDLGQSGVAWTRVAQWLPWMEMGSKPGLMVFNATGFSTFDKNKIPSDLMKILETRYPLYLTPPPLDDDRKNETSWTVFKKKLEAKK